ncbi:hypothetical protein IGI39_003314 [Enterococcus sp. AZ135]|uniref:site-specific integrase n=1 Tax=unclassified Enterococcus TaxID=2608891 RepID=UPI003F26A39A
MATFKSYEKKNGEKAWMFRAYLGKDDATGKEIRTKRYGFKSKKEAQLALNKLKIEFEKDGLQKDIVITFQEAYDLWEVSYKNTVKESTYCKTKEMFELHILPVFKDYKVNKIPVSKAQSFANSKVTELVNYRKTISDASRIVKFAISLGYAEGNPFEKITMPKRKKALDDESIANFFTKQELEDFLAAVNKNGKQKMIAFFRTLAFSGMRVGELIALTWEDVNFKDKTIRISKTLTRGENNRLYVEQPKTKNSKRTIPMDQKTLDILKHWRSVQRKEFLISGYNTLKPNQLLFSNERNTFMQLSKPRKWMNSIIKQNNLKRITIHGLRHTHATMLLEAGVTVKDVQVRLGHASIQITMDTYLHITDKRTHETVDQLVEYTNF